jgi:hypothetical protein
MTAASANPPLGRQPELLEETVVVLGDSGGIGLAAGFVETPLSASLLGHQLDERRSQLRAALPIERVVGPADVIALASHNGQHRIDGCDLRHMAASTSFSDSRCALTGDSSSRSHP